MRSSTSTVVHKPRFWVSLLAVSLLGQMLWFTGPEARPVSAATGLVPSNVRTDLPIAVDGTVFDLEQMGNRIFVAGSFTQVRPGTGQAPIAQAYLYAYDIDTGELDRTFNPVIDREVEQIVPSPDGSALFIVGAFNNVDGTRARKIARLNVNGTLDTNFKANGSAKATAVAISPDGNRLFVGGRFTTINGTPREGLAELDAHTGTPAPGFTLGISGPIGVGGAMSVKGLAVNPDGNNLIVMATARFIGDQERYGLAKINISGATASMSDWRTRIFEENRDRVGGQFWLRGFDISPDGSFIVVTTSGGDRPPTNDVAIKFNVQGNNNNVQPDWITRNFDSTYSAAIDDDVVYIGGHFQYTEAPGAMDPYPGDPEKSYGFGGDQDASILGDQVIARQQVAALDPATGHALGWNPGANGFNGVYALEVIERGLLLGHDGDIVGDKAVGRSAFFDRNNGPGPVGDLDTIISSPLTGSQFDENATVLIEGTATAPEGIAKVQVTVYDLGEKTWLQPDGTFGAAWAQQNSTLATAGATQSDWSFPVVLPQGGEYQIKAKTFDLTGAKDGSQPSIRIRANDVGVDEAPDTLLLQAVVTGRTIRVNGTATDDSSVSSVRLVFIQRTQLGTNYLQPDGTLGNYYAFRPTLTNPGATGTNWDIEVTVPLDGAWTLQAWAIDNAGQKDDSKARATRQVGGDVNDEAPSVITIDAPVADARITTEQPFTITGSAQDDIGVDRVAVRVVASTTARGLQQGGTIAELDGTVAYVDATLANRGATTTDWSISVPALPAGRYRITAIAYDAFPQSKVIGQNLDVLVNPTEQLPIVILSQPVAGEIQDPTVVASGRAMDNVGVDRVELGFYFYGNDGQSRGWLRADNTTISNLPQYREATVTTPGTEDTTWTSGAVSLPFEGRWFIRSRSWDTAGQPSETAAQNIVTFSPNDARPTIEVQSLAEGDLIAPGQLAVNGVIFDDQGAARVQYYVRRRLVNEGPNPNLNSTLAGWFDAFVTQPGGIRSNYAFTTPDLEPGPWFLYVRGFDDAGQLSETTRINFTVGIVGNGAPDALITTPRPNSADATSTTVTFAGTASDDQGVAAVQLLIYDYQQVGFVRPDGGVTRESALAYHNATIANPGAPSSDWTYSVTLPADGQYYLRSVAYDDQGMRQVKSRLHVFWVTPGDAMPAVAISTPAAGATVTPTFAVTGTASDDIGVERVQVLIRNEDNRSQGLRADGTVTSSAQWLDVELTPGQSVTWSGEFTVPAGRWRIDVRPFDTTDKFVYGRAHIVTVP